MKPNDLLAAIEANPRQLIDEAARLRKWRKAAERAHRTGKMANTLAKALAGRFAHRWQFMDFRGPNGHESSGVVDILAIRKCGKPPGTSGLKKLDSFDIQLIQVKGGGARLPTFEEISRLRLVQQRYHANRVVLFQWIKGETSTFSTLESDDSWSNCKANQLFGVKS